MEKESVENCPVVCYPVDVSKLEKCKMPVRPPASQSPATSANMEISAPIGFFGVTGDRKYDRSSRQFRYFRMPPKEDLPLNLNAGVSEGAKPPDQSNKESLDFLLYFLQDHYFKDKKSAAHDEDEPREPCKKCKKDTGLPEFITMRGILSLLMHSPFDFMNDWCLHVTRFKDSFYICKRLTSQCYENRCNFTEAQRKYCSWGFIFEQMCSTASINEKPVTNQITVNENMEFCFLFKASISDKTILYAAEMDGIISDKDLQL